MRRIVLVITLLMALSRVGVAQSATTTVKLSDLGWLAGCWEMQNDKRGLSITEMWMKPEGDAMMGVGRTVKARKVVDFEFLRIIETPMGLAYVSRPSANKDDTSFALIKALANEIVFENPAHDFPQRIIYRREGERLHARIEGAKDGKSRGIDFPYNRAKCE